MATQSQDEPINREPSPEERGEEREVPPVRLVGDDWEVYQESREVAASTALSPVEEKILHKVWHRMRLFRPGLYKVFKPWSENLELRDERSRYSHGSYRGWYAEQARRLRLTENAVKARLRVAQKWFAKRIEIEFGTK